MKNNKAFTLIETLIAMVIGVISVAAISYSYIYFLIALIKTSLIKPI